MPAGLLTGLAAGVTCRHGKVQNTCSWNGSRLTHHISIRLDSPVTSISVCAMAADPINAGFIARHLTLIAVAVLTWRPLRRLWKHPGGVLFGPNFCIKTGYFTTLAEAHVMQYVAARTSIPVPRIFCAFTHRGQSYIVMERLDGDCVGRGWVFRTEESKARILGQLRSMVEQLRSIQPPNKHGVSNIVGGPIYDPRLPSPQTTGPFSCIDDFHRQLRLNNPLDIDPERSPADLLELFAFYRQPFADPVLTHGDLSSMNVLVKGDDVVGIVDWETAGWFPSYWEYACAWNVNPQNEFWQQEVDKFVTPMPYELKMESIRRKYFGDF
ncbi:kinase-like protein [Xylariaceae sp. FL1272]|nr:kinase-like protein [Xylariaceae sp. FL1272]